MQAPRTRHSLVSAPLDWRWWLLFWDDTGPCPCRGRLVVSFAFRLLGIGRQSSSALKDLPAQTSKSPNTNRTRTVGFAPRDTCRCPVHSSSTWQPDSRVEPDAPAAVLLLFDTCVVADCAGPGNRGRYRDRAPSSCSASRHCSLRGTRLRRAPPIRTSQRQQQPSRDRRSCPCRSTRCLAGRVPQRDERAMQPLRQSLRATEERHTGRLPSTRNARRLPSS